MVHRRVEKFARRSLGLEPSLLIGKNVRSPAYYAMLLLCSMASLATYSKNNKAAAAKVSVAYRLARKVNQGLQPPVALRVASLKCRVYGRSTLVSERRIN